MADPVVRVLQFDKMDIYDIPIVSITDQYIAYLHSMTEMDLEEASQFLVMASLLLQIKSRMLLPRTELEEEDEADPREMLVQMLVEYRHIKAVARQLELRKAAAAQQHTRKPFFADNKLRNLHYYPVSELLLALAGLTGPLRRQIAVVERQEYDVSAKMQDIVRLLGEYPEGIEFEKAFVKTGSTSERVASFLAVLELLRLKVLRISQSMAFAPIYLFLRNVPEPVLIPQLAELLGLNKPQTWELLGQLQEEYNTEKRGLELREVAEGWQLCTKACHHEAILQLANTQELKLSNASMETLAIIAYRQPVTRTEMEAIRGVKVDGVVNTLLEWELIAEAGRKETAGRPILYKTTKRFLEVFGLKTLKDLPAMPDILAEDAARHPQQISLLEMEDEEEAESGTVTDTVAAAADSKAEDADKDNA